LYETPLPGLERALTRREGDLSANYLEILVKWQRLHRLVGSTDITWLVDNVILDSLAFLAGIPGGTESIVDIGSGAGIPGIPISIVNPGVAMCLVEARSRRASFLATVVRELLLDRVIVIHGRAESLPRQYLDHFDVAVMRCAGRACVVVPTAMRLVRSGGSVVVSAPPAESHGNSTEVATLIQVQTKRGVRAFYRYEKNGNSALTD
jgi:16S rRNA (guanine527-N7)-methyltransferase